MMIIYLDKPINNGLHGGQNRSNKPCIPFAKVEMTLGPHFPYYPKYSVKKIFCLCVLYVNKLK